MHRIFLEDDVKPTREHQRRLNPHLQEVVKKEVLKLLFLVLTSFILSLTVSGSVQFILYPRKEA